MEQEKKKEEMKAAKEKQKHEKTAEKQEAALRRKLKKELKEKKRVAAVSARFVWTDGVTMELLEMSKETKDEHDNQDASMTGYKIWSKYIEREAETVTMRFTTLRDLDVAVLEHRYSQYQGHL